MRVYAVIGYDQYYPCSDNVLRVFLSEEAANSYCEEVMKTGRRDFYDVITYEVVQ